MYGKKLLKMIKGKEGNKMKKLIIYKKNTDEVVQIIKGETKAKCLNKMARSSHYITYRDNYEYCFVEE